ncbi:phage integrase SAM-like domain-containing protein, partial [Robertkochia sediminum]|uniref:phage integrase SAM-like domain-containing protein n=1 Tax=Robertkochia sediminum TaxID=2785326 RepID=UPI001932218A
YLGKDDHTHTLRSIFKYHETKMKGVLAHGTLKNYGGTEKYVFQFLKKTQKVSDLELRAIESSFIIDFEHFLHQQP